MFEENENALIIIALNEQDLKLSEAEIKKAIQVREINPKKPPTERQLVELQDREDALIEVEEKKRTLIIAGFNDSISQIADWFLH